MSPQACACSLVQTSCSGHAWNILSRESVTGVKEDHQLGTWVTFMIIFLEIGDVYKLGSFKIGVPVVDPEGLIILRHSSG